MRPLTTDGEGSEVEFEIKAQDLVWLLVATIPLASTNTFLAGLNCVMLRRQGNYLTATASDRYVAGIARRELDPGLPAPEPGWSFPLGLKDAKELLKLARSKHSDKNARARFVGHGDGWLDMPLSCVGFREFGLSPGQNRDDVAGFPAVHTVLARNIGQLRQEPCGVSGIDLVKIAQFAPAARMVWKSCGGYAHWWRTDDAGDAGRWVVRIGDDFIGLVMGVRLPVGRVELDLTPAATRAEWSDILRS